MKKHVFFIGILFLTQVWFVQSMDQEVAIASVNGEQFTFKQNVIELSETIKHLIEDVGINEVIPLPNVFTKELTKIAEILNKITNNGHLDLSHLAKATPIIERMIKQQLKNLNAEDLYNLVTAVNYLDIPLLLQTILDITAEKIAVSSVLVPGKGTGFDRIIGQAVAQKNGVAKATSFKLSKAIEINSRINSVVFSPNGENIFVSGLNDPTVYLWNTVTSKLIKEFKIYTLFDPKVIFSPDRKAFVSGLGGGTICLWNSVTGDLIKEFKGSTYGIDSVAFSPDGKILVTGFHEWHGSIHLWDSESGELIKEIKNTPGVNALVCSPDGKLIIAASYDGAIRCWNAITGELIKEFRERHTHIVNSITCSSDGKIIISEASNRIVRIWDAVTGELIKELKAKPVVFLQDGKMFSTGSYEGTIYLWNTVTGDLVKELKAHTQRADLVACSPDGKTIVSRSCRDRKIRLWNTITGDLIKEFKGYTYSPIACSPDGKVFVLGSQDGTIYFWNIITGELIKELKGHTRKVSLMIFSPDGKIFASGSDGGTVCLWDAITGELIQELNQLPNGYFNFIVFSSNGKSIAIKSHASVKSENSTICLWFSCDINKLILQEIQVLGWALKNQKLEGKALEIYENVKKQYPQIIQQLNL